MTTTEKKSIGSAIDEIISALSGLDEPTRTIAVKAACEHLGINIGGISQTSNAPSIISAPKASTPEESISAPTQSASNIRDIRSLKDEKQPANGIEMACVVAYYLENHAPEGESSPDVHKTDLEKYFKQAGFPLPKAVSQTLVDAKAAGYMDSTSTRGRYKLNPVGHNLVAHSLPRKK